MNGGKQPHGFTIIETMIFLAVSGIILLGAIRLISGKQSETEFTQGMHQIENQLQGQLSNVADGSYVNTSDIKCVVDGDNKLTISVASVAAGTNFGCQYIGAAIQFGPETTGTSNDEYIVYPIAGLQYDPFASTPDTPITTLSEASPTAIYATSDTGASVGPQVVQLPYGIKAAAINGGTSPSVVGFFTLGQTASDSDTANGNGTVEMVPLGGILGQTNETTAVNTVIPSASSMSPSTTGVTICFNSGTTDQSGIITLGGSSNPTAVDLTVQNGYCTT